MSFSNTPPEIHFFIGSVAGMFWGWLSAEILTKILNKSNNTAVTFIDLAERSRIYAAAAHTAVGQLRKYTGEPYITHLINVAKHVQNTGAPPFVVAAAYLHDVLEDTLISVEDISKEFGDEIASLVCEITNVTEPKDGNRHDRMIKEREHISQASPYGQTIKLADLIDNCESILSLDPEFSKIYLPEKIKLLEVLPLGDAALYQRASSLLCAEMKILKEKTA